MIGEVILKNKLFSGESINIEYKVEMPKKSEKYMKTVVAFANAEEDVLFLVLMTRH